MQREMKPAINDKKENYYRARREKPVNGERKTYDKPGREKPET